MIRYCSIAWHLLVLSVLAIGAYYRIDWSDLNVADPIPSAYICGATISWTIYKLRNLIAEARD